MIFYPLWDFDVPLEECVVTVNSVQITGSNKPIVNNGNGTYNVPKYTRLEVETEPTCNILSGANFELYTRGNETNGSPEDKSYVIITGNPVEFYQYCQA